MTEGQEVKKTLLQHAMQAGLYISLIDITYNLLMYISGIEYYNPNSSASSFPLLSYVIIFGGLLYFAKQYRNEELNGYISYGGALGHSILTSFFYSLVMTAFSWIFLTYIAPDLEKTVLALTEEYMLENGTRESDVEKMMEMQEKLQKFKIILSVVGVTFFGSLLALITSIFVKKEQAIFEYEDDDIIDS